MRSNNYRRIIDIFEMPDKEKERYKGMDDKIDEYRESNNMKTFGELLFETLDGNINYRTYCFPLFRCTPDYESAISKVIIEWKTAMKNNCFRLFCMNSTL
jgi:hypothetical protein|nr:MAG TPA: hypothetical protein [Caudoviricetes sp.]